MFINATLSQAPKERQPVATGASPWNRGMCCFRPNGAGEASRSIKNIFLIKYNFVRAQEFEQFIPERFHAMMLLLSLDVVPNFLHLRLADAKNAVALLPGKLSQMRKSFVNPARRIGLQISHQRRDGFISSPAKQNVNVVGHAANFQSRSAFAANDAAQIFVDARTNLWCEPRFSVFGAEHKVKFQVVKRAGHGRSLVRRPVGAEEICSHRSSRVSLGFTRGYRPELLRSIRCKQQPFS